MMEWKHRHGLRQTDGSRGEIFEGKTEKTIRNENIDILKIQHPKGSTVFS
jgi:hypothetical protein